MKKLPEKLKMVIWDLDDTFWSGTLSEGKIEIQDETKQVLKHLLDVGIVSSICSKNNFKEVQEELEAHNLWECFVFPSISFESKGERLSWIIESMQLRPENVLFIDDNVNNLQEAASMLPDIGVALPTSELFTWLLKEELGKPDPEHTRLFHYKSLEKKYTAQSNFSGTNRDFLRSCEIQIRIDFDYKSNYSRILELIERTNQLNFTKKRLSNENQRNQFNAWLEHFQRNCGVIYCRDKFGDHGAIGFYMVRTTYFGQFLDHFVFSCRIMNMGIESFIYQHLKCPALDVAGPVAYPLDGDENIDWIELVDEFSEQEYPSSISQTTLLLGPCNLLQASAFLGNTTNFLHTMRNESWIRFDCPGFFLANPEMVKQSSFLARDLVWNSNEFFEFHQAIKGHENIVLDIFDIFLCEELGFVDGIYFRSDFLKEEMKSDIEIEPTDDKKCRTLLEKIIEYMMKSISEDSSVTVLLRVVNELTPEDEAQKRLAFAEFIKGLCNIYSKMNYIELTPLLDRDAYNDGLHLNRSGYYKLAKLIEPES